jgi:hypothetical protein
MSAAHTTVRDYSEEVPASRWLRWLLYASVAAVAGGMILVWRDGNVTSIEQALALLVLVGTGAVMLAVSRWLLVLRIRVSDGAVEFRYGRFGRRIPAAEIEAVEVEPYRWVSYGGWGIRFSTGGRRAYSVPFMNTGVRIAVRDGKRYYVSSAAPDRLAAAVKDVMGSPGGRPGSRGSV